jgi:hypothetical protein
MVRTISYHKWKMLPAPEPPRGRNAHAICTGILYYFHDCFVICDSCDTVETVVYDVENLELSTVTRNSVKLTENSNSDFQENQKNALIVSGEGRSIDKTNHATCYYHTVVCVLCPRENKVAL